MLFADLGAPAQIAKKLKSTDLADPNRLMQALAAQFTFTVDSVTPTVRATPFPMLPSFKVTPDPNDTSALETALVPFNFDQISVPCNEAYLDLLEDPLAPPSRRTSNAGASFSMSAGVLLDYFRIVFKHLLDNPDPTASAAAGAMFLLHGLRLSPPDSFPKAKFPFYSLLGQQWSVAPNTALYSVKLENASASADVGTLTALQPGWNPFSRVLGLSQSPPYVIMPRSFALARPITWSSKNQRIYALPASLRQQLASNPIPNQATDLIVSAGEATDKPSARQPVTNVSWATRIQFTVHRVPDTSGTKQFLAQVYEVAGMEPANQTDLQNLIGELTANPPPAPSISLLFPDASNADSVTSNTISANSVWLVKSNLSTTTDHAATSLDTSASADFAAQPADFLRLLWESATVQSGGFFLVYTPGNGLPDTLFGLNGIAALTLLIQLAPTGKAREVYNCMVCDPPSGSLVAIDPPQIAAGTALPDNPPALEILNATLPGLLRPGSVFEIPIPAQMTLGQLKDSFLVSKLSVRVVRPGGPGIQTVQNLAKAAGRNPADFAAANPDLPVASTSVPYTIQSDDTLLSLSLLLSRTITDAATICSQKSLYQAGTPLQVSEGWIVRRPALRTGTVGVRMVMGPRDVPALDQLFSYVGAKLEENEAFRSPEEGFPAGPRSDASGAAVFQQVLFTAAHAKMPLAPGDPYGGLGHNAHLSFQFQDLFGNRYLSDSGRKLLDVPVLYRDSLMGLAQWPGTTAVYELTSASSLQITLRFEPSRYMPGSGSSLDTVLARATADLDLYNQIAFQIGQNDVKFFVSGTLQAAPFDSPDLKSKAPQFVDSVRSYLFSVVNQFHQTEATPVAGNLSLKALADVRLVVVSDLAQANQNREILVPGASLTVPVLGNAIQGETVATAAAAAGLSVDGFIAANPGANVQPVTVSTGATLSSFSLSDSRLPFVAIAQGEVLTIGVFSIPATPPLLLGDLTPAGNLQQIATANQGVRLTPTPATQNLAGFVAQHPGFPQGQILFAASTVLNVGATTVRLRKDQTIQAILATPKLADFVTANPTAQIQFLSISEDSTLSSIAQNNRLAFAQIAAGERITIGSARVNVTLPKLLGELAASADSGPGAASLSKLQQIALSNPGVKLTPTTAAQDLAGFIAQHPGFPQAQIVFAAGTILNAATVTLTQDQTIQAILTTPAVADFVKANPAAQIQLLSIAPNSTLSSILQTDPRLAFAQITAGERIAISSNIAMVNSSMLLGELITAADSSQVAAANQSAKLEASSGAAPQDLQSFVAQHPNFPRSEILFAPGTALQTAANTIAVLPNEPIASLVQRLSGLGVSLSTDDLVNQNPLVKVQLISAGSASMLGQIDANDPLLATTTIAAGEKLVVGSGTLVLNSASLLGEVASTLHPKQVAADNPFAKLAPNSALLSLADLLAAHPAFPKANIVFAPFSTIHAGTRAFTLLPAMTLTAAAQAGAISVAALVQANATSPILNPSALLEVPRHFSLNGLVAEDLTFDAIASALGTPLNVLRASLKDKTLNPGMALGSTVTRNGETLATLAQRLNTTVDGLAAQSGPATFAASQLLQTSAGRFRVVPVAGTGFGVPARTFVNPNAAAPAGTTLQSVATASQSLDSVISANQLVDGFLASGLSANPSVFAHDNLASLLARSPNINAGTLVLQTLPPLVPPPALTISISRLQAPAANAVTAITVAVQIKRDETLVNPLCKQIPNVLSVESEVKPAAADAKTFATAFEGLFPNLKIAIGPDTSGDSPITGASKRLFAVPRNLATPGTPPIVYAIRPLLNTGWSGKAQIDVYPNPSTDPTSRGTLATGSVRGFLGIDVDVWGRDFLQLLDLFLSPAYAAGLHIAGCRSAFQSVLNAKADIARAMRDDVVTLLNLATTPSSLQTKAAKDAVFERVLVQLSEFYKIDAIVQFPVATQSLGSKKARLSGKLTVPAESPPSFTLSDATVDLTGGDSELTFLVAAGGVPGTISLQNLAFQLNALESNIQFPLSSAPGYESYDWLTVPLPLSQSLTNTQVPIPLRSYPIPPSLLSQSVSLQSTPSIADLSTFVKYTYAFNFNYTKAAPDELQINISTNVAPSSAPTATDSTADTGLAGLLAQFHTISDALKTDLSGVTLSPAPESAKAATDVFASLATKIGKKWGIRPARAVPSLDQVVSAVETPPSHFTFSQVFNLIDDQNVRASLHVARNAVLGGKAANPDLIYQVPTVSFPNSVAPLFRLDTPVDLNGLAGGTLEDKLKSLFSGLFGALTPEIRISAFYQFSLNTGLTTMTPILLLPKQPYKPDLCHALSSALLTWKLEQAAGLGSWVFDLSVYSTLSGTSETTAPLLEVTRLFISTD